MTVVDTDLGEWIVQLRDEPPSHIVLPAIHIKKEEVGEIPQTYQHASRQQRSQLFDWASSQSLARPLHGRRRWHHRC